MIFLVVFLAGCFLSYCYGVYEERKRSREMLSLYLNTVAKMEKEFKRRQGQ